MEGLKENKIARIGCGIFIIYILIILVGLLHIIFMNIQPKSWFEVNPIPKQEENCDSLLRVKCDSLAIDYNTIGTTTDPD
jgi:hypothetical protein